MKSHDSAGRKQSLVAKAGGDEPSDGEMPWPESLRGDDAERAKGTGVSGNNSVRQGWYAGGSQKNTRDVHFQFVSAVKLPRFLQSQDLRLHQRAAYC